MRRYVIMTISLLMVSSLFLGGCGNWLPEKLGLNKPDETMALTKVEIHFDNEQPLVAYVKTIGIDQEDEVYSGGSSRCYYYDQDGNIQGAFNYQRVTYIKKLE